MIFTLTDRMYNVLDAYETDDYLIGQYVGSILETLDINVLTKSIHADLWTRGNYIMCQDKKGRKYWFTIYDDEDGLNDDVKSFSCYSGTIDIVSEEYPPISATQAQPFEWYFNRIFSDTGITLGINEISGLSRKLEFTSENATNAEMLQFVLNGFDNAEAQLDVKFDGSTPTELILNVYKRIGEEQPQAILSDEDDSLTDLTRKGSLSELGTCLDLEGAEVDEKTITLAGKYYEEKDAAGNILYYSPKNLTRIFSVRAHEDYYVKLPNKAHGEFDGYINRRYKSEAKTQDALWAEGLARLKKIDHAVVDYDAKGDINCGIGDNVQVVSHTMRPPVMVSARTTEYKFNDDDRSRNEYKFSNYVDLESDMGDLTSIINKIKDQIVYVVDQSVMYCLADQGNTAPVTGWTNVNPGAVKGKWLWTRTKIDYSNGTSSVSEVPTYSAINGEPGKPGTSPIITPNDDGTITILDVEGEKVTPDLTGPEGKPGDKGIGIDGTKTKTDYQLGTSATTAPTGTWLANPPAVTVGKYLWTRTILTYTDGTKSTPAYSISGGPGADGEKGDDALPIFDGHLTAPAIILSATNSGAVSDFSKATGTFVTYLGQDQLTSGVTYSRVSQSDITATINTTTGVYSVTAASADTGMAVFRAKYGELTVDKMVSVTKAKQGAGGPQGVPGPQGDGSYLHVGWKMADGTFSTVYPSENYAKNSQRKYELSAVTNNGGYINGDIPYKLEDLVGKYITISVEVEARNAHVLSNGRCRIGVEGNIPKSDGTSFWYGVWQQLTEGQTVEVKRISTVLKVPENIQIEKAGGLHFYIQANGDYFRVENPKIAIGQDTIYTPAPSEDYTNAYPKYRGEYTDTIESDSADPTRYTWTAYLGEQGPPTGVISQSTAPSSPYVGMLWQCTGNIAGYINPATYRWNGSAWTIYQFTAQNILAETFTGFVFRGVDFIGSRFINEWTDSQAGNTGRMQIADGELTSDYWLTGSGDENNTSGGHFSISRDGILTSTWKNETVNQSRGYVLTDQFLEFFYNGRSDLNGSGRLTARQLTQVPWTNLPYESGFTTAENNPCQYRVVYLLDGSRELQMRGQVQNTAGTALPTATSPYIGLLPETARPIRNELIAAADSTRKGARVAVLKNGYIQIDTPNAGTTYVSLGGIRILLD